ncbi:hypothetical protein L596_027657 [Steinernema carpocapsae]|uniref:Uncharacterized protein n=1 Tax=Steinernema carpocapsae TaxID=34508 RepID=A0A4U5LW50_STECR|nr:hypothetical protein L596_027657 [Steinernema carpocapsae]
MRIVHFVYSTQTTVYLSIFNFWERVLLVEIKRKTAFKSYQRPLESKAKRSDSKNSEFQSPLANKIL